jgi:hypothetical protein
MLVVDAKDIPPSNEFERYPCRGHCSNPEMDYTDRIYYINRMGQEKFHYKSEILENIKGSIVQKLPY